MGNKEITIDDNLSITNDDWQFKGKQARGSRIVYSWRDNLFGEEYVFSFDPKLSLEEELNTYTYRKYQNSSLVKVYGVQILNHQSNNLCGNYRSIKVITERIQKLWSEMPQLTINECIYGLSEALKGYKECYDVFGQFTINDNMVGINSKGELKVWLNQHFPQNHPRNQRPILQISAVDNNFLTQLDTNKDEEELVKNIVNVFEDKCEEGKFPLQLKQKLAKKYTFFECERSIQDYVAKHNILIINKINPDPSKCYTIPNSKYQYWPSDNHSSQQPKFIPPPLAISQLRHNKYFNQPGIHYLGSSRVQHNANSSRSGSRVGSTNQMNILTPKINRQQPNLATLKQDPKNNHYSSPYYILHS